MLFLINIDPRRRPKIGFISNELITEADENEDANNSNGGEMFDDDDVEIDETINNNVEKAIERMDCDDVDVEKLMDFSSNNTKQYSDESDVTENHDVNHDETRQHGSFAQNQGAPKPKACGHGFRINEAYLDKF